MSAPVAHAHLNSALQTRKRFVFQCDLTTASLCTIVFLSGLFVGSATAVGDESAAKVDFQTQIAPILEKRCAGCHGAGQQEAALRLDQFAGLVAGASLAR